MMEAAILTEWIRCPVCGNKTRNKVRADTELKNFPLFCVVRQIKRGCFRQIKTVRQEASGKHPVTLLSVYLAHWKKQQATHAD